MGFRFRRSIRLAPGVRLNLSSRGLSATVGPRGANVNVGPHGTYVNVGIPGTGLSSRTRVDDAVNGERIGGTTEADAVEATLPNSPNETFARAPRVGRWVLLGVIVGVVITLLFVA